MLLDSWWLSSPLFSVSFCCSFMLCFTSLALGAWLLAFYFDRAAHQWGQPSADGRSPPLEVSFGIAAILQPSSLCAKGVCNALADSVSGPGFWLQVHNDVVGIVLSSMLILTVKCSMVLAMFFLSPAQAACVFRAFLLVHHLFWLEIIWRSLFLVRANWRGANWGGSGAPSHPCTLQPSLQDTDPTA